MSDLSEGDLLNAIERQEFALCAWVEGKEFGLVLGVMLRLRQAFPDLKNLVSEVKKERKHKVSR